MSDQSVIPILADLDELHTVLAKVAERHFREHTVKEVDALSTFMCAVRAKGESRRVGRIHRNGRAPEVDVIGR